jgi:hypothetical protein
VEQAEVYVEAATEGQLDAENGGHDDGSVCEDHRHHEPEEHRVQRGVVSRAVAERRVRGPEDASARKPDVTRQQWTGHKPRHAADARGAAGDVIAP